MKPNGACLVRSGIFAFMSAGHSRCCECLFDHDVIISLKEGKYIQAAMSTDHHTCPLREGIVRAKVCYIRANFTTIMCVHTHTSTHNTQHTHMHMHTLGTIVTHEVNCLKTCSFIQELDGFWNHIVETQLGLL